MRLTDAGLTAADRTAYLDACEARYRDALNDLIVQVICSVPEAARERIAAMAFALAQAEADLKIARDADYQMRFAQDPLLEGPR